jgi:hypothetical protein
MPKPTGPVCNGANHNLPLCSDFYCIFTLCHCLLKISVECCSYRQCLLWATCDQLPCDVLYSTVQVSQGAAASQLIQTVLVVSCCDQLPCDVLYCTVQVSQGAAASQLIQTVLVVSCCDQLPCNVLYCTVQVSQGAAASQLIPSAVRISERTCLWIQGQVSCSCSTTGNPCSWYDVVMMVTAVQCNLNIYQYFALFSLKCLYIVRWERKQNVAEKWW